MSSASPHLGKSVLKEITIRTGDLYNWFHQNINSGHDLLEYFAIGLKHHVKWITADNASFDACCLATLDGDRRLHLVYGSQYQPRSADNTPFTERPNFNSGNELQDSGLGIPAQQLRSLDWVFKKLRARPLFQICDRNPGGAKCSPI